MHEGGCYCGSVRYRVTEAPVLKAQCHCRACAHITGGGPNYFLLIPQDGFEWVTGTPKTYTRPDKENAVTRSFCAECGTHMTTDRPGLAEKVVKAGTLDAPDTLFDGPRLAIFCAEKLAFQVIPDGLPAFDALPDSRS